MLMFWVFLFVRPALMGSFIVCNIESTWKVDKRPQAFVHIYFLNDEFCCARP